MMSGRDRHRISLSPFSSTLDGANRSPRKSASDSPRRWIITPQEPSRISTRARAAAFSAAIRSARARSVMDSLRLHAQHAADGHGQLRMVRGVEMEVAEALLFQLGAHLGRH